MKKKKFLIYFNEYHLKPIGGPAGYLYNLKLKIDELGIENIEFISGEDKDKVKKDILHNKLPKFMAKIYYFFNRVKERKFLLSNKRKETDIDISKYDAIHFHSTISLYKCKDSLDGYTGKIILTSHSPKPMFLEKYEDTGLFKFEKIINKNKYMKGYSKIDEFAFDRADYIIFPCEEAEEPYYNNWSEYDKIKTRNKDKYRYLLTGIKECEAKIEANKVRETYNIGKEKFVISYVGRHNETKGYDTLKMVGQKVLKDNSNCFLIAGREEPLKGLKNDNWIEVGWTKDPHSIINASDVFILPNKETYFDLVMLEVLSLGKIIIASNTGGNKLFDKLGAKGIFLYNNSDELELLIKKVKKMDLEERKMLENSNKTLFKTYFTNEIFTKKYVDLIENL